MPVTLVVGERDRKFMAIAERMASGDPDRHRHGDPGAGHAAHLEHPVAVRLKAEPTRRTNRRGRLPAPAPAGRGHDPGGRRASASGRSNRPSVARPQ